MDQSELNTLFALYRARLLLAGRSGDHLAISESILRDIASKVRKGELTQQEANALTKKLINVSVESAGVEGVESLSESLKKSGSDINYNDADDLADRIFAMRAKKND